MKILKITLTPLRIFLTLLISVFKFVLTISTTLLCIFALVALAGSVYFFVDREKNDALHFLLLAWFISPWGLPTIATWFLSRLIIFRDWLKAN